MPFRTEARATGAARDHAAPRLVLWNAAVPAALVAGAMRTVLDTYLETQRPAAARPARHDPER